MWQMKLLLLLFVVHLFAQCQWSKQPLQSQEESVATQQDTVEFIDFPQGYKLDISDYIFVYDNVSDRNTPLTSYLKSKKTKTEKRIEFPLKDTILNFIDLSDTVPASVFKAFAEYNAVNMWLSYNDFSHGLFTREEVYNRQLNENTLIYNGQITLSDSFESYLFSLCDTTSYSYSSSIKIAFLLNMKDDAITSIAELFRYGKKNQKWSSSTSITIRENKVFHRADVYFPTACDVDYEEDSDSTKYLSPIDFKYDDMGQIVILRCPMDYYDEMNRRVEVRKKLKNDTTMTLQKK